MSERLKKYWTTKQASLTSDSIGAFNPIGVLSGAVHGLSKDDLTIPDDDLGYAPGVGISRIIRRLRRVRKESVPNKKRQSSRIFIQEPLLKLLSLVALPALGAGVGAAMKTKQFKYRNANAGANIGLLAGTGAAVAIPAAAMILAAIRRKRTKAEQAAAEKRPLLMHAIPGYSAYENSKRLGASTHFEETTKERAARKAREAMENEK